MNQRPAIVLTGARQTGKTSLIRHLFPHYHYVSLDLPEQVYEMETDPSAFFEKHPPPIILDEIQHAPKIFPYLKHRIDKDRKKYGQFILTGSQKFSLMRGISESLAGRVALFELEPLSFKEIHESPLEIALDPLLIRGGYPELYENEELDPSLFYQSYVATYLERDIRTLLNVKHLLDFERFLRACALRSGCLLNKSDLARDVGITPPTANDWLSVLEASNQISLLEPWFSHQTKTMVKSPKLYMNDVGLMCFLVNIRRVSELMESSLKGAVWETFVFAEMRKALSLKNLQNSLFYWRDRSKEVDFVIDRGRNLELFEAKWSKRPQISDFAALDYAEEKLGRKQVVSKNIVCRTDQTYAIEDRTVLSVAKLFQSI